jgi:uncharacterized protein YciI
MQYIKGVKMKNPFVVILRYLVDLEEINKHRPKHLEFLSSLYENDTLIASGPQIPRTGGVLIAKADSRSELEDVLQQDPFAIHNLATYEIYEFELTNMNDMFKQIMYKDL